MMDYHKPLGLPEFSARSVGTDARFQAAASAYRAADRKITMKHAWKELVQVTDGILNERLKGETE